MSNKTMGYVTISLLFTLASAVTMHKVDGYGGATVALAMIVYAGFALYQASRN